MNLPALQNDENPYLAFAQSVNTSRIVGKLLKFGKTGEFTAGEESKVMPPGTRLIVHIPESLVGWQKWEDGKPVDAKMGKLSSGFILPKREELGDTDKALWPLDREGKERDPWQLSAMILMKAPDSDQIYTFASGSKGGIGAAGKVAEAYGHHMRRDPRTLPVVELGRGSYKHPDRSLGEILFPVFQVVDWAPREGFDAALDPSLKEPELAIEAAPAKAAAPDRKPRF